MRRRKNRHLRVARFIRRDPFGVQPEAFCDAGAASVTHARCPGFRSASVWREGSRSQPPAGQDDGRAPRRQREAAALVPSVSGLGGDQDDSFGGPAERPRDPRCRRSSANDLRQQSARRFDRCGRRAQGTSEVPWRARSRPGSGLQPRRGGRSNRTTAPGAQPSRWPPRRGTGCRLPARGTRS